jgi:hypothetical protein
MRVNNPDCSSSESTVARNRAGSRLLFFAEFLKSRNFLGAQTDSTTKNTKDAVRSADFRRFLGVVSAVPSGFPTRFVSIRVNSWLTSFQKQTHAVEINDGMADVERVHAEDAGDFGVALLQCELRQRSDAKAVGAGGACRPRR